MTEGRKPMDRKKKKVLAKLAFDYELYSLSERVEFARNGEHVDALVHDESAFVRFELAKNGYGLEMLKSDPNILVRMVAYGKPVEHSSISSDVTGNITHVYEGGGETLIYKENLGTVLSTKNFMNGKFIK